MKNENLNESRSKFSMLTTETRECGICMDRAASLRCQRCSYVFCEDCCQKLATYRYIKNCIQCNKKQPWIKSLEPGTHHSERITQIIISVSPPDIENQIMLVEARNRPRNQKMDDIICALVAVSVSAILSILVGMLTALIAGAYDDILASSPYTFVHILIFMFYGFMAIGCVVFICICCVSMALPLLELGGRNDHR